MAFQRNWDCESGHILHETGKLTITLICIVNIYIFFHFLTHYLKIENLLKLWIVGFSLHLSLLGF